MIIARQPVLGFALRDGTGSVATCRLNLYAGITVADGHAAGDSLRGVLGALSGAVVVRQSIVYPFTLQDEGTAWPGSQIENRATLIFECTPADQLLAVSIPAPRSELVLAAGPLAGLALDLTQSNLLALISEIITGLWCNPFGYDAVELGSTIVEVTD